MRPLTVGIILFLIWASLSSWYYVKNIFPVSDPVEEIAITEEVIAETEIPDMEPTLPDLPESVTLYFDYNKSDLKSTDALEPFLSGSLEYLQADKASCILITGYTCSKGSENYNQELGKRRAEEVKAYLMQQGLSDECVKTLSKGESNPEADNSTEEGRMKNRRAQLKIEPKKQQ